MILHVIIKMKIIIVVFLSIFYYPKLIAQDDSDVKNQVICSIAGKVWRSNYVFNESELPQRCDIITVGQFAFDRDDGVDKYIMESDRDIIRSLVGANRTVFTRIGFVKKTSDWPSIFDHQDNKTVLQEIYFNSLIHFLNESKVNGIIINCRHIYNIPIENFAVKVNDFVSEIKNKIDNLIVGLVVPGLYYENFSNDSLFDFSITNQALDFYAIDWSILNNCENDTVKTGLSPVTSTNPAVVTIEQVTSGVTNSSMDTLKIYAMVQMLPVIPINLVPKGARRITTYSIYCDSIDPDNSSQWCTNPSKLSYDQGAYAKEFYAGIVLEQLDTDDYEGCCECEKFPVTNLIIDGWMACPLNTCSKLDQS